MTVFSAPGFLVPDDLETSFQPPGEAVPARGAALACARRELPAAKGLVYRDPAMYAVVQRAERIARSDASVLVHGKSGTGKEVIARYIHHNSPRASGPFVAVNCAAIPEQLLESELFGHERGAFSGALGQRIGKLEAAQNGTILLDEISEMDRRLQAKLLRALQEREVDRIGGRAPIPAECQDHRHNEQRPGTGGRPADLSGGPVFPAERRRRPSAQPARTAAGYPGSGRAFHRKVPRWDSGRSIRQLSPAALAALMTHDWPGNVRELENTIHRALVLTTDGVIGVNALEVGPPSGGSSLAEATGYARRPDVADYAAGFIGRPLHLVERDVIIGTLQLTGGNRTRTAMMLGLSIRALRNKISLYAAQGIAVPPSSVSRISES